MKKLKIDDDRFIIKFKNDYLIVNEFTFNMLKEFNETNDAEIIAKKLNISVEKVHKYHECLENELNSYEYYNFNNLLEYPLKLQWKITNNCNIDCKHCYIGNSKEKQLSNEELLFIAKEIIEMNVMEVTISGGEALCVNILPEILCKLIDAEIQVTIFTNGILLKDFIEKIKSKVSSKNVSFEVSVDGMKFIHDSIRGAGNFKKTITGIKAAIKNNFIIKTNSVLTSTNYKDISNLYRYLKSLGVDKIQVSNVIIAGNATEDMKLTKVQNEEFIDSLRTVLLKTKGDTELLYAKMPDEGFYESEILRIKKDNINSLGKEKWECSAGIGKATISSSGKIYCCPFLDISCIGSILDDDFKKIWNSDKRYKFLKYIADSNRNKRLCVVARNMKEDTKEVNV